MSRRNNQRTAGRPAGQQAPGNAQRPRQVDMRSNPLYPDRIESNVVGVLIAIAAVAVMVYGYVRANREDGTTLKEMFIPETTTSDDPVTEPTEAADMLPEEGAAEK